MMERIRQRLQEVPEKPGVYLMKDDQGEVIYVGKAKVLKNRVKSYFYSQSSHSPKVRFMVSHIHHIDWVVTGNENEAFALEINLIKQFMPRYNIMLRDDKHYPYLRINLKADYPRLDVVRRVKRDGAKYFGPYFTGSAMREMLDIIRQIFPIRMCKKNITKVKGKERPCLNYHIKRCMGPCQADVTKEDYKAMIGQVVDFLTGKDEAITADLTEKMQKAAANMEYERAATYRDRLEAVNKALSQQQRAIYGKLEDWDVVATAHDANRAVAQMLIVRSGRIIGTESFKMDMPEGGKVSEIMDYFVTQYYMKANVIPRTILLSDPCEDQEALEEYIASRRDGPVHIAIPQRGEKKQIVAMALDNAKAELERSRAADQRELERTGGAVDSLQRELKLKKRPTRIEAYDISNIQGVNSVASMVVFIDGKPARNQYRRFRIKTVEGANDFMSMAEVIHRRFKRGLDERATDQDIRGKFAQFPDLVLIDGGKGQLAAARESMEELGVGDIQTIGLAKREEEIFFPKESIPVMLSKRAPALHVLQRVRDEAHRFAITYHRSLRRKGTLRSELDDIEGIGAARRRALLMAFPTLSAIKNASFEELMAVEGMSRPSAQAVYDYYHPQGRKETKD